MIEIIKAETENQQLGSGKTMRTTYVTPITHEAKKEHEAKVSVKEVTGEPHQKVSPVEKQQRSDVLLIGLDFGTNKTCYKVSYAGSPEEIASAIVPTLVGYAKDGIVHNLLPDNATVVFGEDAMAYRLYVRLVPPLVDGVVADIGAAQDFLQYIRRRIAPPAGTEVRAVIGVPASSPRAAREKLMEAIKGIFDKVIFIPEPFLAALGVRDESKLKDPSYIDPIRNSLFVDIGAGTTDVCLVQGYYPGPDDQVSSSFAGDKVDAILAEMIKKQYPDVDLSIIKVREIKERFSYVGTTDTPATVNIIVKGKTRRLDLTEAIGDACSQLLQEIFDLVKTAIVKASSDSVGELLQNIFLTGGGSQIRNIDTELQKMLTEEGFEKPRVQKVGPNYKEFVAKGALKAARYARESQWERPPM